MVLGAFRCVHDAKELKLKRKLQRYRLQSDVAMLHREVKLMRSKLHNEQLLQQRVARELR